MENAMGKLYFFCGAEIYGFVGILENFVICYNCVILVFIAEALSLKIPYCIQYKLEIHGVMCLFVLSQMLLEEASSIFFCSSYTRWI